MNPGQSWPGVSLQQHFISIVFRRDVQNGHQTTYTRGPRTVATTLKAFNMLREQSRMNYVANVIGAVVALYSADYHQQGILNFLVEIQTLQFDA